jgi:hypothetical protein
MPAATKVRNSIPNKPLQRRRRDGTPITKKPVTRATPLAANQPTPGRSCGEVLASALGAFVETLRLAVVLGPVTDTEDALREQVISAVVEQGVKERLTVPLKPFIAARVIVEAPDCPGEARLSAVPPTAKSCAVEKPVQFLTKVLASTEPRPVTWS